MTSHAHHENQRAESALPVARIQAQDVAWAEPLREYLQQNGCETVLNREAPRELTYLICAGDTDFVKAFFEGAHIGNTHALAIVYEGEEKDVHSLRSFGIKLYFADAKPLTSKHVQEIFSFFFTSKAISINARKEPTKQKVISVMAYEPSREQPSHADKRESNDRLRIAKEMQQVYQKNTSPRHSSRAIGKQWFTGVILVLLCILTPIIFYCIPLLTGVGLLALSAKTLMNGNTQWTRPLISYSDTYLSASRGVLTVLSPVFILLRQGSVIEEQDRFLSIVSQISAAETGMLTIFHSTKTVAGGVLFPNDTTQKAGVADVINLATEVSRVSQHLSLIAAQLDSLVQGKRFPFNVPRVSVLMSTGIQKLSSLRSVVGYTDRLLTLYPRIAGFRKKQTYLILLQNSTELRPTGGFIGSLLIMSFLDGRVDSLDVQDVYTADGQLKGHIDPPLPIREILGREHWYLRDSNWDPDFSVSGEKAAWFYEKELGQSVDGVIAISLPMVTQLLKVTGPIELLDFNERISESNFFAKSLLYTETDFFPGSTQKKDFLGALISALMTRVTSDRSLSSAGLLSVLTDAIQSRDLQFYFSDTELQALVTQWGWNGGVSGYTCAPLSRDIPCVGDGVAIVDANLGVNKSNFFITKDATSNISILENGDVDNVLTVNVRNASSDQGNGGGTYQSYMRMIMPLDAQIRSVTLDGIAVPLRDQSNPVPPPAPYWVNEESSEIRTVHIPFSVLPHQSKQLVVHWFRPGAVAFMTQGVYQFMIRKQPGVPTFPWNVTINYPETWGAQGEGDIAKPGSFTYNTDLIKDASYKTLFQKKL